MQRVAQRDGFTVTLNYRGHTAETGLALGTLQTEFLVTRERLMWLLELKTGLL